MLFKVVDWGKIKKGHRVKITDEQIRKLYLEITNTEKEKGKGVLTGFLLPIEREYQEDGK